MGSVFSAFLHTINDLTDHITRIKQIIKKIIKNISVSQIATDLLEPLDTIQPIYDLAIKQAPDFDAEKILAQLIPKTTESLSK